MEALKDSGIEWCEQIPTSWESKPNKYVMRKQKDICSHYDGEDILSLTMQGVIVRDLDAGGKMPATFDGYQRLYPGNLLMCLFDYDVTPRCIGLIKNRGLTSPAYSQFILNDGYSARYYYYYYLMIDHTKELLHLAKNLRHSFTEEQIGALNVPVPPLAEQELIADFLDEKCAEIDKLSDGIQKQIDILAEYKKTIVSDAITGKYWTGKKKESNASFIGEIPCNWDIYQVKHLFTIGRGRVISALELDENGKYPVYSSQTKNDGCMGYINTYDYNTDQLTWTTDGVYAGTVFIRTGKHNCTNVCGTLRLKNDKQCSLKFLKYALECIAVKHRRKDINGGKIMSNEMARIKIPIPPLEEQLKIVNYLDNSCSQIDDILEDKKKQLKNVRAYRNSLIYEYVTGKKRVKGAA